MPLERQPLALATSIFLALTILVLPLHGAESVPAASGLANMAGQPADIAGSAYQYRADRAADQNDPESWILVMQHAGQAIDQPKPADVHSPAVTQVLRALLWEEVRQVRTVEVQWNDGRQPPVENVALLYADSDQWWKTGTKKAAKPEGSPDGRRLVFSVPQDTFGLLLCLQDAQGRPLDATKYAVPAVRVYGPGTWKKIDLEIEWGFEPATAALGYDGRIQAYDGVLADVEPLPGDQGTVMVGPCQWRSAGKSDARRGVRLSLLYMGSSPWRRMWPNVPTAADLPRTIVTVRTASGSLSFLPADLENGPVLAPEYGFFVRRTSNVLAGPKKPDSAKVEAIPKELLTQKLNNLLGEPDLRGWGTEQTPWLAANTAQRAILANGNLKFPARCVAVHPGEHSDVGVGWRSPIAGKVGLRASVAGLQPGGDGVVWSLVKESAGRRTVLFKGVAESCTSAEVGAACRAALEPTGDAKQAAAGRAASGPPRQGGPTVAVGPGDTISLVVNRRGAHFCDSTAVRFILEEQGGQGRTWDLTKDLLDTIHAGNPHADGLGNAAVWSFYFVPSTGPGDEPPAAHQPPFEMQSQAASAREFLRELQAKGLKTIRQRVREMAEQTWEGAMKARQPGRTFPAMPKPDFLPAMKVEVPCQRLNAQWDLGAWHILRHAERTPQGQVRLNDFPYSVLAEETYLMIYALDLAGMHKQAAEALDLWLDLPLDLPKPTGYFSDGRGVFSHAKTAGVGGDGMDTWHTMGPGTIGWVMAEHYRLTGNKEWLKAKAPRMKANVEWILRQRRLLSSILPGGERLWSKGLTPAHQLTPDAGGLFAQFYVTQAYYWLAVQGLAEVLADIDPADAKALAAEADAYRRDILAAVDRSIVLSPVVPVRDGTYRSFIPTACHVRGCASLNWIWRRRLSLNHWDGIAWDISMGAMGLIEPSGLLSPADRRAQGHLDVLEDRFLLEHRKLSMRKTDYDAARDWFNAGWHHQCAYERNGNIHLALDDAPNFLRTVLNQYAVHVVPGPYTFNEHSTRGPEDKPFEEAGFMERFRDMLVQEDGAGLWLARAVPRAWLEQGKKVRVTGAPTYFGPVSYEIASDVEHGKVSATIEIPSRREPVAVFLRLRHPQALPLKSVTVNGKPWQQFEPAKELVRLEGVKGSVKVEAEY